MSPWVIFQNSKWQNIGCHQNSCEIVANGHTYEIFYTLNESE
jgi:hypothetical protein